MLNTAINTNNQNANLYSKFANNNISSNKAFLSSAYGKNQLYASNHDVTYYNDENAVKKTKKSKKKAIAITAAAAFSAISILGFALLRNKGNLNYLLKETSKVAHNISETKVKKTSNFMMNFATMKDDLPDRIITDHQDFPPLRFLKKYINKYENFYFKNIKKSVSSDYNKAIENIKKLQGGSEIEFVEFDKLFDDLNSSIRNTLKKNRITNGLFEGSSNSKFTNFTNNMTSSIVANDKLDKSGVLERIPIVKVPEGASEELQKEVEKLNKILTEALVPKLRDVNCGSPFTDALGVIFPMTGLGIGIANADDNEERKSILLDIGFPLIGTVTMPLVGTVVPVLNGIKAMVAGFAVGQLFSGGAKIIDNALNKAKQKKNNQNQVNA